LCYREKTLYFVAPACENTFVLAAAAIRSAAHREIAMSIKRLGYHTSQDSTFAAPARPLGDSDLALVQSGMAEIAPEWSVELHGICVEEATLVLLPEGGDDAMGPSFMISRETYGFRLDQVHWDVLTEFGVFASLNDVVAALGVRLAFAPGMAVPDSVTIH
jgi:hypothetical protein